MTNLIPPEAKKIIKHEYWIRVFSVWGVLLGISLLVLSTFVLPTYVIFSSQLEVLETEGQVMQKESEEEYADAREKVSHANSLSLKLSEQSALLPASQILDAIQSSVISGVTLDTFSYSRDDEKINEVKIQGIASSRTVLSDFTTSIESHELFTEAEVPISSLVRDKDLPFDILVVLTTDSK